MSDEPIIRGPRRPSASLPRYACPEHGPLSSAQYDINHRCVNCGRPIMAIRKLRERHDSVALPRQALQRIIGECGCAHTANALQELMEAHDADL